MPVKLARLLLYIAIVCSFDSHPRIDSVFQKLGLRYGLLENAIIRIFHEARYARREKCAETGRPWPVSLSPTVCVGPIVPTQAVGSKFLRCAWRICKCIHALVSPNIALSCNIRASVTRCNSYLRVF
ncbi:MAG: hypothetical protein ACK5GN_07820 [Pseudomonadota bacterium]